MNEKVEYLEWRIQEWMKILVANKLKTQDEEQTVMFNVAIIVLKDILKDMQSLKTAELKDIRLMLNWIEV